MRFAKEKGLKKGMAIEGAIKKLRLLESNKERKAVLQIIIEKEIEEPSH